MNEHTVKIKVAVGFKKHERTDKNPWGYEIEDLTESIFSACKIVGCCVARSVLLCDVLLVRLRVYLNRVLPATILLLAITFGWEASNAKNEVRRISSTYSDLSTVQKIYLHAGLITVVEFPGNILEVRLGNPGSIKAQISTISGKELTLYLSEQRVEPTKPYREVFQKNVCL